jgi:HEPN domain-containing protein
LSAQECVEFSLKGALKRLGIEYPWTYDAGWVLEGNKDRLTKNMLSRLDWLKDVSRRLAMKRSQAAYGDEAEGVPAGQLFEKTDAATALREAREVLALCSETPAKRTARKR